MLVNTRLSIKVKLSILRLLKAIQFCGSNNSQRDAFNKHLISKVCRQLLTKLNSSVICTVHSRHGVFFFTCFEGSLAVSVKSKGMLSLENRTRLEMEFMAHVYSGWGGGEV